MKNKKNIIMILAAFTIINSMLLFSYFAFASNKIEKPSEFVAEKSLEPNAIPTLGPNDVYEEEPYSASIIQLMANPKKYHGKKVLVSGILCIEFEADLLFLNRDDYDYFLLINSVATSFSSIEMFEEAEKHSGQYVSIIGTYNMYNHGHLGGNTGGAVENIEKIFIEEKINRN